MINERKYYKDCAAAQKYRHLRSIRDHIMQNNEFLRSIGLKYKNVELENLDENENKDSFKIQIIKAESEEINPAKALLEKDKIYMSDKNYSQFKENLNLTKLTGINAIKQKIKWLGKENIFRTIHNTHGSFNDVTKMIEHKIRNSPLIINDSIIKIKFSADGKFVSRKVKSINITFTIINEGDKAKTASGNYTLGIFKLKKKEDYAELSECFHELGKKIDELEFVKINEKTYHIQKYFGGDLKIMLLMCGINADNFKYPCLYEENRFDVDKDYSIQDLTKDSRSLEDAMKN
jgi:hypothetical protein